jgi:hypothetical protein
MKTFYINTKIVLFLLLSANGIKAQTTQPKLDQVKMFALMCGTWQCDINKDTSEIFDLQQYGNAFVETQYLVVKGKKALQVIYNYAFSAKENKFKGFLFYPSGSYATMIVIWTTEKKLSFDFVQDFNPEKVLGKAEAVFDTPESFTVTFQGVKTGVFKWHKIK